MLYIFLPVFSVVSTNRNKRADMATPQQRPISDSEKWTNGQQDN